MDERMTKEQLVTELLRMRQQFRVLDSCRQEMQLVQAKYARHLESAPDAMLFVVEEVGRLESILRDILSFSRGSSPRRETCDIRSLVEEGLRIFVEACKERSISTKRSFHDVAPIEGDNERILEVVENRISNAIDAMPLEGELAITTGSASLKGVPYATITVSDTGEGIRDEDLPRIFEPFFTTKISPKGVGLGLPIVKKFMEDHGGLIDVKSRVGTGTTFVLYFPYPESIGLHEDTVKES
jgi:signal transduction histidine kinase